jgi:hypothetical protein
VEIHANLIGGILDGNITETAYGRCGVVLLLAAGLALALLLLSADAV